MHITLRQLEIFEAVARHSSFTRAAEALHLSQPSVSIQVRQLSEAIGQPLFEQIGRRVALTQVGEMLYSTCRELNDVWSRFEMTLADHRGMKRGRLRLAVVMTSKYFAPRMLGAFCRKYPELDVELEILNREGVLQRLRQNLDDIYVLGVPPEDLPIVAHPFLENPLVVIAPLDFPTPGRTPLQLEELARERFIMRESGSGTRLVLDEFLRAKGVVLNVKLTLGSNEAIKQAVSGGMGLSVLSQHAVWPNPEHSGVKVLNVRGFPIKRRWYLVHLRDKRLSVVAQEFLKHVLDESESMRLAK
jgi:DNA-binding transcriptional LysR family regulator